ncbi:PAS domain-containing protein [Algihabitans albus]|uniref:PAS domain-containing protein n=1 Tax=Algihabitans albus TaxID=2164067 RepID=UPI0013C2CB65|nr:PAS domain-containing protein [Algihabitans albus]
MILPNAQIVETEHRELRLDEISNYPTLRSIYQLWAAKSPDLPSQLDPTELPPAALPYVMLLDVEHDPDELRVRLAGTRVCELHGGELRGHTTRSFFGAADAQNVLDAARILAETRQASLAHRRYVSLSDRIWTYTRLLLPLSSNGVDIDRFFKVVEPISFTSLR